MAFEVGTTPDQPWIDPPAHRIGVDVMRLSIPDRFTFGAFVETVGDAVRTIPTCFSGFLQGFPALLSVFSVVPFPFPPSPRFHVSPKRGGRNDWLMIYPPPCSHMAGYFFAAYATREANPESSASRLLGGGPLSLLSHLDA